MTSCPVETFPALDALRFLRAAFIRRAPDVDVLTDRETAMVRLWDVHRQTADEVGFVGQPFATAEQVHGNQIGFVETAGTVPGADGLITSSSGICLAIYVADCGAVYIVDRNSRMIGLVHSGKKGTELGIVPRAIEKMCEAGGSSPKDFLVQIGPCIRPPHYEIDFAAEIARQARSAGVADVFDCGHCTASEPELYYSYRREKGRTGRMLALLALTTS